MFQNNNTHIFVRQLRNSVKKKNLEHYTSFIIKMIFLNCVFGAQDKHTKSTQWPTEKCTFVWIPKSFFVITILLLVCLTCTPMTQARQTNIKSLSSELYECTFYSQHKS